VSALTLVRDEAGVATRRLRGVTEALNQATEALSQVRRVFFLRQRPYVCSAGGRLHQPYCVGGPYGSFVCRSRETSDATC
jgi:hypothetical protein